jgi:hypothetical protein
MLVTLVQARDATSRCPNDVKADDWPVGLTAISASELKLVEVGLPSSGRFIFTVVFGLQNVCV